MRKPWIIAILMTFGLAWADDPTNQPCAEDQVTFNDGSGFSSDDFVGGGQGLLFEDTISPDPGTAIDTENIVFPTNQPFYVDYISEGAGASHTFGFFFLDIDTNRNGFPDFFEVGDDDDLDGDGLVNSEDDDDDNDGILDVNDNATTAGITHSTDPALFRRGVEAAAAGNHVGDYWQFVPNNTHDVSGYTVFVHPGAYLYVDADSNDIPDILEYNTGANKVPAYCVDKGYMGYHKTLGNVPGLLGTWYYAGSGTSGATHWTGSTIFFLCDDDGGTGQTSLYHTYSPYGTLYNDNSGATDANTDYLIYGSTNPADIPDEVEGLDDRGVDYWKYRWYQGDVSGGREFVFFLVVYYGSGGSSVNTYFSKTGFNPDNPPGTPGVVASTTGDDFGGWTGKNNWFPTYRNMDHHKELVQAVFGVSNWTDIATAPTDGSSPVAVDPANQAWVDEWENWRQDRRIIQYRGLADWFDESAVDANQVINGRYGINMALEGDSSAIRAINDNMAHLMVGAPQEDENAWLLGWEDLFGGGDRDYEDVVFYVRREATGNAQTDNLAKNLDRFEDVSLTQVEFTFVDNFTDEYWGTEGTYINYFYRLATTDEWIPLLGGQHERTPNVFTTTEDGGLVTRHVVLKINNAGKKEVFWMVEMKTADVDTIVPEVHQADVAYQALVHGLFFNSAVIPSSNVVYFGAYETPSFTWKEKNKNRGHVYCVKTFEHGTTLTPVSLGTWDPFLHSEEAPSGDTAYLWDAGYTITHQGERNIMCFVKDDPNLEFATKNHLTRHDFAKDVLDEEVVEALELSDEKVDGEWVDNYHEPGAATRDQVAASTWLANWVHGYRGAVTDGETTIPGAAREWLLGGINRSSTSVVRAPGVPDWLSGSGIPVVTKRSYSEYMEANKNLPTRLLVGSEAGMLHMLNAGWWVGRQQDPHYDWADGHYDATKPEPFGDGSEVWAMIPDNLLEDMKYNYTGRQTVSAKIDATVINTTVYHNDQWRRIAAIAQGEDGGNEGGHTGNVVWVIDITDVDNPIPLWSFRHPAIQDIYQPMHMAWAEIDGQKRWVLAFSSGVTPNPYRRPMYWLRDAYTGEVLVEQEVLPNSASDGHCMGGPPALVDTDDNGLADQIYGVTSKGVFFTQRLTDLAFRTWEQPGEAFYLTPNISLRGGGSVLVVAVSGDNPVLYDEAPGQVNSIFVYSYTWDTDTLERFTPLELPAGHKAFARPKIVGTSLVVGTTTGDTFSFCDPNPADPGNLYLFKDVLDLGSVDFDDPNTVEFIQNFGSIKAPIMVNSGVIHVHKSDPSERYSGTSQAANAKPTFTQNMTVIGNLFGIIGWKDVGFEDF